MDVFINENAAVKDTNAVPITIEGSTLLMTVTSTAIPDPSQSYVLKYKGNPFFNDRVCISTSPNGMLSSVEVATEDATPQIVVSIAALAQTLSGLGGPPTPAPGLLLPVRLRRRSQQILEALYPYTSQLIHL